MRPAPEVSPTTPEIPGIYAYDCCASRFTSKERDSETGLDYFGARYFSSAQGRFTGADSPFADQHPADPQSWNLYAYVRNNPLKNTDRNGRDCFQGLSSCASYLIGGLKAAVNIVPGIATLLNHGINRLTGSSIPDAPTLQPANVDEAQGSEAFNVISALSPIAEIGTATSVITYGAEATAASEGPTVGETVYRVWGDQSGPYGKSWTPVDPETVQNYRSAAGLPDWNSGTQLTKGTLTNTEGVTVQPATPLHGNPGGLKEYVVPDPKSQVDIKSIKLKENPPIN